MKKRLLWSTGIIVLLALVVLGVCRYIEVQNRQSDPNWKLAEQIYNMENALKEVDEDYECRSISKVTPYTYADPAGNTIVYYIRITALLLITIEFFLPIANIKRQCEQTSLMNGVKL